MDTITRRKFLLASGVGGGAVLAAGAGTMALSNLLRLGSDEDAAPAQKTLVLVTLYGGNDGLNMVVPYNDPAYYSLRPEIAYAQEKVLPLNGSLGFNPVMGGLAKLWKDKVLSVVLGVGYPKPDRSHFRSMDIWQTAAPQEPVATGWVGRWLDGTKSPAEAAVSFEPVLPPLLVGKVRAGACVNIKGATLPQGVDQAALSGLARSQPNEPEMLSRAALGYADLLRVDRLVREADRIAASATGGPDVEVPATGTGGENSLLAQLETVARCVEARVPTRIYSVSLGGFDTHAQEVIGHERLLRHLDEALSRFADRMSRSEPGRKVTVLVYSEFGRRVRANASEGTDHGTAGPVLMLGSGVAGGFHGEQPSLSDLDDGDLKATMDFRDVFGTVIGSVLGADPDAYLEGYKTKVLPLFNPE